ncbi:SPFH domain-containing protein [Desulfosporosinus sp. PR]|uniref:SPFH domain-containing protein n=1 Tax=Candidatus Desulfosporosinus nitrosoreducens TaxID=3401928 RepID=UPI0027ED0825|nr:SPFH domain-containing protein [Desulfosporosinus sp. PR]MDQ7094297.1 SPFH domain-containing protein [Desulfosporosinus sp. PR]
MDFIWYQFTPSLAPYSISIFYKFRYKLHNAASTGTCTKNIFPLLLFLPISNSEIWRDALTWAAQTALRDIIGRTQLAEMLAGRENIDEELRKIIDLRTEPWGVSVQSVEIRDVIIPKNLQDAMSREAQAERERKARIVLGTAETEIATKFAEAAKAYENNPVAMHLRAMNMLYEGLKEKGALVVVPSTAVETMGLGTITGLASMAKYPAEKG